MKGIGTALIAGIGGCILSVCAPALAGIADELYQEGLMKEIAKGDVEAAIEVYGKIVEEHAGETGIAASAQLHIGICYEKLGKEEEARDAYQKVVKGFPTETEMIRQALERLEALKEAERVKRPAVGAGPEKTRTMIEELDGQREGVKSCRASVTITMEMMGNPVTMNGSMLFERPEKFRVETMGPEPLGQTISIFDGQTSWVHQSQANRIVKIDVGHVRSALPDFRVDNAYIFNPFPDLDKTSIRYIRSTSFHGKEVYVFQGVPDGRYAQLESEEPQPSWIEVWVGRKDGLTRRWMAYRETGREMMSMEMTVEAINPPIPESTFVFMPPGDVQIIDQTETVINRMRQMKGETKEDSERQP